MISVRVIDSREEFLVACGTLRAGRGPVAIDAERASGFTYSQRAYLIQVYRRDAGSFLFDPPALGDMSLLLESLPGEEWIFHAASQDLACLREVGIDPPKIFDTELSARLLGMERVGLGAVVENILGIHLAKEHSAVNWSTRPLPEPWLAYASADVEHLVDLRDELHQRLVEANKITFAEAEFEAARVKPEKALSDTPWRKLSGLHSLRQPRQLAVARALWFARDELARSRDISPGRLIPDSAIIAAASSQITSKATLIATKGFNGRDARGSLDRWWAAIQAGLADSDVPPLRVKSDQLPAPRMWRDKNPEGYARLTVARHGVSAKAEELNIPIENLLAPAALRSVAWEPPTPLSTETVSTALLKAGARPWQIRETAAIVSESFVDSELKLAKILPTETDSE